MNDAVRARVCACVCVQLVGCALLAVGIWAKVDESSFAGAVNEADVAHSLSVASWVIIVVGAVIFILGFLGCCGAIRESQCMLATVRIAQSCPFVRLTHGLGWVGLGWVHYSKSTKNLKGLF